jgi:hypothetical protein
MKKNKQTCHNNGGSWTTRNPSKEPHLNTTCKQPVHNNTATQHSRQMQHSPTTQTKSNTLLDDLFAHSDYETKFIENIDRLIHAYADADTLFKDFTPHQSKIECIRRVCYKIICEKFELEYFIPRNRSGNNKMNAECKDIFTLIHSYNDALLPLEKINSLFKVDIKPSQLYDMMIKFKADTDLLKGETNKDISTNLMTLGSAFELLITQNMEILGKLSEHTKEIAELKKEKPIPFKYVNIHQASNEAQEIPSKKKKSFYIRESKPE